MSGVASPFFNHHLVGFGAIFCSLVGSCLHLVILRYVAPSHRILKFVAVTPWLFLGAIVLYVAGFYRPALTVNVLLVAVTALTVAIAIGRARATHGLAGLFLERTRFFYVLLLTIMVITTISGVGIGKQFSLTYLHSVPIVFLSAHGSEQNRIASYEAGGMLFLAKPFAPAELIAVLRSITSRMDLVVKIKLDQVAKRLIGSYRTRHLSDKEYTLLCNLALNYPELTPYDELIDALSIDPSKDSRSYLEVIVSRLRSKLLRLHEPPLKVLNRTRQGYVLNQAIELE